MFWQASVRAAAMAAMPGTFSVPARLLRSCAPPSMRLVSHTPVPAFCNTDDKKIISQILNNYDRETTNFYRWKVWNKFSVTSSLWERL